MLMQVVCLNFGVPGGLNRSEQVEEQDNYDEVVV